jgi:predicted transcriptional regulator
MRQNETELTAKQTRTIEALLVCKSIETTAKKANISKSTLYRWLKDENFQSEFRKAKFSLISNAITTLQRASTTAVNVLCEVMNNEETSAGIRVNASRIVLEQAIKCTELEDLEKRITDLEEATR